MCILDRDFNFENGVVPSLDAAGYERDPVLEMFTGFCGEALIHLPSVLLPPRSNQNTLWRWSDLLGCAHQSVSNTN